MPAAHLLAVNEIFGPTFQGEGPSAGTQAKFLRLAMCNLKCSWCDTPFTWDWAGDIGPAQDKAKEIHLRDSEELFNEIDAMPYTPLLVITGGEPLLQQKELAHALEWYGFPGADRIEIETNGTVRPSDALLNLPDYRSKRIFLNVSPKLENSGNPLAKRRRAEAMRALAACERARFKFVVENTSDLDEVRQVAKTYGIMRSRIWIMPQGVTEDQILNTMYTVAPAVLELGYNLSTRLHVLLWGNKRGV